MHEAIKHILHITTDDCTEFLFAVNYDEISFSEFFKNSYFRDNIYCKGDQKGDKRALKNIRLLHALLEAVIIL